MKLTLRQAAAEQLAETHLADLAEAVQALRDIYRRRRRTVLAAAVTQALKENEGRLKRGHLVKLLAAGGFTSGPVYRAIGEMAERGQLREVGGMVEMQP